VLGACNYIRTTCADVRAPRTLVVHLRQEEINFRMLALVKRNRGTSSKMISIRKKKIHFILFGQEKQVSTIHGFAVISVTCAPNHISKVSETNYRKNRIFL
jgi:hypothetical protein